MVKWFFFSSCHWILLEPLNIESSKVCVDGACPSLQTAVWFTCSRSRIVTWLIDVTWQYTVTSLFQLQQLQADDIKPIRLDTAFHVHHFWKSISPETQLNLWHRMWILMGNQNNISIIKGAVERRLMKQFLLPITAALWERHFVVITQRKI